MHTKGSENRGVIACILSSHTNIHFVRKLEPFSINDVLLYRFKDLHISVV